MNEIDMGFVALAIYVVFSALFSLGYSHLQKGTGRTTETKQVSNTQVTESKANQNKNKGKKILPGFVAVCNICDRRFENDTYLKNHLGGQKHLKKAEGYVGEVYRIEKDKSGSK